MRRIYIHIGCGKTGSSALQVWLNQNAEIFHSKGLYYPTFGKKVNDDEITSGNGTSLVSAIQTGKTSEFISRLLEETTSNILLSSEAFQILTIEQIEEFKTTLDQLEIQPKVIAYVRDLLDILNSGYSQLVKRHAFTQRFDNYVLSLDKVQQIQQFDVLSKWSSFFPDINVLHYDSVKKTLSKSFLYAINILENEVPEMKKGIVNRSLSPFELEMLRYINELYLQNYGVINDKFPTAISDSLLKLSPEDKTAIIYNAEIEDHLNKVFGKAIEDFNLKYFNKNSILKIFDSENKNIIQRQGDIDLRFKDALKVMFKLLMPRTEEKLDLQKMAEAKAYNIRDPRFIEQLYNHALQLEASDLNKAMQLMSAARALRPEGPVILAKIEEYERKLFKNKSFKIYVSWDYSILQYRKIKYSSAALQLGWCEQFLVHFGSSIKFLILKHDDGRDAIWYFDQNGIFLGDDMSKIHLDKSEFNGLIGSIFQQLLDELTGRVQVKLFLPFVKTKGNFYFQIKKIIDSISAIRPSDQNISDEHKLLIEHLLAPGRSLQDSYIESFARGEAVSIAVKDNKYATNHGLVLSDYIMSYPCKSDRGEYMIIFEGGQYNSRFAILDCASGVIFERPSGGERASAKGPLIALLDHICDFSNVIQDYLAVQSSQVSCILRNEHLGHNLWNDLTGLHRIAKLGLASKLSEIILFSGASAEPWLKMDEICCSVNYERNITNKNQLIKFIYGNNRLLVRLSDDYIPAELASTILTSSSRKCVDFESKQPGELRVVFGLRLENRTWLNQKEGLLKVSKYLARRASHLTIIVDGHDKVSSTNAVHRSHHELADADIVLLEKEIALYLKSKLTGMNIKVVDAVGMSIECTLKWIDSADFFIAPWGAGLAKYKWLSNLPGVLFTSNWNIQNKKDLLIYERTNIREGAIPCVYVESKYIKDADCTTNNVTVGGAEDPSRADFIVDVDGIKAAIDKVLHQLEWQP